MVAQRHFTIIVNHHVLKGLVTNPIRRRNSIKAAEAVVAVFSVDAYSINVFEPPFYKTLLILRQLRA
jgi:hypothetical protein